MTNLAHEVVIEQMEWGEWEGTGFPAWLDEYVYVPTEDEASEAAEQFGELEDELDIQEFEEWIDGLQSTKFFQIRSAIEVLRSALSDYQGDLNIERLLKVLRPA